MNPNLASSHPYEISECGYSIGLSKMEYAAIHIAAGLCDNWPPDQAAARAVATAVYLFRELDTVEKNWNEPA